MSLKCFRVSIARPITVSMVWNGHQKEYPSMAQYLMAENKDKAKYEVWSRSREAGFDVAFADLRCRRAPHGDEDPSVLGLFGVWPSGLEQRIP